MKPVKKSCEPSRDEHTVSSVEGSSDSCYIPPKQPEAPPLHFYLGIQSLSTSDLALGDTFPAVPTEALPPAVTPLAVAPPDAVVTTPGFVAMADPDDAFCNASGVGKVHHQPSLQLTAFHRL